VQVAVWPPTTRKSPNSSIDLEAVGVRVIFEQDYVEVERCHTPENIDLRPFHVDLDDLYFGQNARRPSLDIDESRRLFASRLGLSGRGAVGGHSIFKSAHLAWWWVVTVSNCRPPGCKPALVI
jgi:hypothetical protein